MATITDSLTESDAAAEAGLQSRQCDRARVLVVDDEATIRRLYKVILTTGLPDCVVEVVENGREAVDSFAASHHAVLLMDLHMPVLDGRKAFIEIMEMCRERNWEEPAVVFCTGFAPHEGVLRIVNESDRHCLLSKPVRADVLVNSIKSRL